MPPRPIGSRAMTSAERTAKRQEKLKRVVAALREIEKTSTDPRSRQLARRGMGE